MEKENNAGLRVNSHEPSARQNIVCFEGAAICATQPNRELSLPNLDWLS
jgi:hypothetical protein